MRIERLNYNSIKIFLTIEDLTERGLTKEDIWKDSMKWHSLFHDMLEEASEEFGVTLEGSVAVEIFSLQAQGMMMIVTMEEGEEEVLHDGFMDIAITTKELDEGLYEFHSWEDVIQLAHLLNNFGYIGGELYEYKGSYFLYFQENERNETIFALLSEYGQLSLKSIHLLREYGNEIQSESAVKKIVDHFHQ